MTDEWKRTTVGEFCPFKYGKNLPERDREKGIFSVFSSAGLIGTHTTALINKAGVIIGRKGTVGSVNFSADPFWPIDTTFFIEDEPAIRDIRYIYYLLKTLGLNLMNTDSAVPGLNRDNAHSLEVFIPRLKEQRVIANFLKQIDDQITLLGEINLTLEEIAQALFKSWFIDFDPVYAKQEGRQPEGMSESTAALFPNKFEQSELGEIPKDWKTESLGNLVVPKRGKTITKAKSVDGNVPVVAGGLNPAYFHNQSNVSGPVITVSASGANAGFVRLYQQDIWASDCSYISNVQSEVVFYFYLLLKDAQEKIYYMQQGAAQPHIYPSDLMRLKVFYPNKVKIVNIFNDTVSKLLERVKVANLKIQTLSSLRDILLPRLISGQLRLSDTEEFIDNKTKVVS